MEDVNTKKEFVELFNSSDEVQELVFNIYKKIGNFNNTKTNLDTEKKEKPIVHKDDRLFVRPLVWNDHMYDELELSARMTQDEQTKFYAQVYGHYVKNNIYRRCYRYSSSYAKDLLGTLKYKLVSSNIKRQIYKSDFLLWSERGDAKYATVHDSHGVDEVKFFRISKIIDHISTLLKKISSINEVLTSEYDNIISAASKLDDDIIHHQVIMDEIRENILMYQLYDIESYKSFNVISMSIFPEYNEFYYGIKYFYVVEARMQHTTDRYVIGITPGSITKKFTATLMIPDEIYNVLKVWFDEEIYNEPKFTPIEGYRLKDVLPFEIYEFLNHEFRYESIMLFDTMKLSDC